MIEENDNELVKKIVAGESFHYRALVEKYQNPVYRVIFKIVGDADDAKEITQDVFVKAYETLAQFNPDFKFFSWIYRIAINAALRFEKRKRNFMPIQQYRETDGEPDVSVGMDTREREKLLKSSIEDLGDNYKSVVLLKYYAELSYTEISESLGIPEKTVKSRLFDARRILKEKLAAMEYFNS